jgi:hypothetical protein
MQYQQLEFLTYERQQIFLEEAEQRRLQNALPAPRHRWHRSVQSMMCWFGIRLVRWGDRLVWQGLRLQGEFSSSLPPVWQ